MSVDNYIELEEIEESYIHNFRRLGELKRLKAEIEDEIGRINEETINRYPSGGTYTDEQGVSLIVTIRRDINAPKVNLEMLMSIDQDLATKVTKFAVDTEKVKEYIARGYFTNTPAEQALTVSYKKPWVQISIAKEEDE